MPRKQLACNDKIGTEFENKIVEDMTKKKQQKNGHGRNVSDKQAKIETGKNEKWNV